MRLPLALALLALALAPTTTAVPAKTNIPFYFYPDYILVKASASCPSGYQESPSFRGWIDGRLYSSWPGKGIGCNGARSMYVKYGHFVPCQWECSDDEGFEITDSHKYCFKPPEGVSCILVLRENVAPSVNTCTREHKHLFNVVRFSQKTCDADTTCEGCPIDQMCIKCTAPNLRAHLRSALSDVDS